MKQATAFLTLLLILLTYAEGYLDAEPGHSQSTQNSVNQTQEDDDYNDDIGNRITQESMEYYVVVFKVGASIQDVTLHKNMVKRIIGAGRLEHEYGIGTDFRGYSALMSEREAAAVESHPTVEYVEISKNVYIQGCDHPECPAPWGLVRSSTRLFNANFDECYHYLKDGGRGVSAYVIDSGIDTTHPEFGGRAIWGYDFVDGQNSNKTDEHGHGTHVAGIIMSRSFGVAKGATAIAVRTCYKNDKGGATCPGPVTIAGVNWVANQHKPGDKSIINMSLGSRLIIRSLNDALRAAIKQGVHVSVSAGNFWVDACTTSPACVHEAVTVSAIDRYNKAYFDYGSCVDISAPGVLVLSTLPHERAAKWSGTSMSAPHVAGAMALILQHENLTPLQMKRWLQSTATKNQIRGLGPGTPNSILYIDC